MLSFDESNVIMGIFQLESKGVCHFAESGIFFEKSCIMFERQLEFDFGVVKIDWGKFAGHVRIFIWISVLEDGSGIFLFGSALLKNSSVVFDGAFWHGEVNKD